MTAVERLRILVVAPERHPLRQPHAGGLEAVVWNRVRWLRARGHHVELCAAPGSDFVSGEPDFLLPMPRWSRSSAASDTDFPLGHAARIATAFDRIRDRLDDPATRVDVVDNHSLHGAPVLWSRDVGVPVVTTLHTPPLPDIVRASHGIGADAPHRFITVSQFTARAWSLRGVDAFVFPNGVDTAQWRLGPGGPRWVWSGRLVPEKAPHLAVLAARRAGVRLTLAGRIGDATYFSRKLEPLLGDDADYVGPLRQPRLAELVGSSAVALVTPVWSEPFGLVLAEALMTGTPVAAFDSGGISEVLDGMPGTSVVPAADVCALAGAAAALAERSRSLPTRMRVRSAAEARYSVERRHREIERVLAVSAQGVATALDGGLIDVHEAVGA